MARGKPHDETLRAAVMAALLAGQGVEETAKQYKLPKQTVSDWHGSLTGTEQRQREAASDELRTKKQAAYDELVGDYLRELLITLSVQARHARDETWLRGLGGSEFAVAHGVLADKAFRILSAAESAEPAANDGEDRPAP